MKLIVGLGNPGKEYEGTRHNVGFVVVDELLKKIDENGDNSSWSLEKKMESEICETRYLDEKLLLQKPMKYMNESGGAIKKLKEYYDVPDNNVWVVSDDLDLPMGSMRIRPGGGSGGHHGLDSIIRNIGGEFVRFRIGIGRSGGGRALTSAEGAAYVLEKFGKAEQKKITNVIDNCVSALIYCLENSVEDAMNKYNKKISSNLPMEDIN
ncbi:aminoacyl-tRNA hydrolase [Patescibacteria group bacterium]|nr:aminoacyl-tRNA hydrolase [Patescibacteria group bacterium]